MARPGILDLILPVMKEANGRNNFIKELATNGQRQYFIRELAI